MKVTFSIPIQQLWISSPGCFCNSSIMSIKLWTVHIIVQVYFQDKTLFEDSFLDLLSPVVEGKQHLCFNLVVLAVRFQVTRMPSFRNFSLFQKLRFAISFVFVFDLCSKIKASIIVAFCINASTIVAFCRSFS